MRVYIFQVKASAREMGYSHPHQMRISSPADVYNYVGYISTRSRSKVRALEDSLSTLKKYNSPRGIEIGDVACLDGSVFVRAINEWQELAAYPLMRALKTLVPSGGGPAISAIRSEPQKDKPSQLDLWEKKS